MGYRKRYKRAYKIESQTGYGPLLHPRSWGRFYGEIRRTGDSAQADYIRMRRLRERQISSAFAKHEHENKIKLVGSEIEQIKRKLKFEDDPVHREALQKLSARLGVDFDLDAGELWKEIGWALIREVPEFQVVGKRGRGRPPGSRKKAKHVLPNDEKIIRHLEEQAALTGSTVDALIPGEVSKRTMVK